MKFLTQLLVILAMITAGISPACAFVGVDKAMMEICASDGTVKLIAIPDGYVDLLPASADAQTESSQNSDDTSQMSSLDTCPFCIFQAGAKTFAFVNEPITALNTTEFVPLVFEQEDVRNEFLHAFSARAPPFYS